MHELSVLLQNAFLDVADRLSRDPEELTRRLARRRLKSLAQPPRAACLTLRASDTRLWEYVTPKENEGRYPSKPHNGQLQSLRIDRYALEQLTRPVTFPSGLSFENAARALGRTVNEIRNASLKPNGWFKRHDLRGSLGVMPYDKKGIAWCRDHNVGLDSPQAKQYAKGKPKYAILPHPDPEMAFDPTAGKLGYRPDPAYRHWWDALIGRVPEDFVSRPTRIFSDLWVGGGPPGRRRKTKPESQAYLDWLAQQTPDGDTSEANDPTTPQPATPNKPLGGYPGWYWRCPICGTRQRLLYLPLRLITLPEYFRARMERSEAERTFWPTPTLACGPCHNVNLHRTDGSPDTWHAYISTISEGLMYGREVPIPDWLKYRPVRTTTPTGHFPSQKRKRAPQLTDRHREAVKLNQEGNPVREVAKQMGISIWTAFKYVRNGYALLGPAAGPRPKFNTKPTPTRLGPTDHEILRLLSEGKTQQQTADLTGTTKPRVAYILHRLRAGHATWEPTTPPQLPRRLLAPRAATQPAP